MFTKTIVSTLVACALNYGGQADRIIVPKLSAPPKASVSFADKVIAKELRKYNRPVDAKRYAKYSAYYKYGWGAGQFTCLHSLWTKESNWSWWSVNKSSGAAGIPQRMPQGYALPDVWLSSAKLQVDWGLYYIKKRYSSPCVAWRSFQGKGWY